ncbi:MAG: hypothetical protein ACYSWX_13640 [Planctomycetota bacterium]|jgi:hypothetical protein
MQARIDVATLDLPIHGRHLTGATLRDQLDSERPTLIAFVRHFG